MRKFLPENRLAKVLDSPNGILFGHAIKKATENLESVRETHMTALDGKIGQLGQIVASGAAHGGEAEVYRLAREIRADAAMFGVKDVTRAAHSLCELMASNRPASQLWQGVAVHVHAISALRQPAEGASEARRSMLEGLEKISRSTAR
jgi:hypothetical protein